MASQSKLSLANIYVDPDIIRDQREVLNKAMLNLTRYFQNTQRKRVRRDLTTTRKWFEASLQYQRDGGKTGDIEFEVGLVDRVYRAKLLTEGGVRHSKGSGHKIYIPIWGALGVKKNHIVPKGKRPKALFAKDKKQKHTRLFISPSLKNPKVDVLYRVKGDMEGGAGAISQMQDIGKRRIQPLYILVKKTKYSKSKPTYDFNGYTEKFFNRNPLDKALIRAVHSFDPI